MTEDARYRVVYEYLSEEDALMTLDGHSRPFDRAESVRLEIADETHTEYQVMVTPPSGIRQETGVITDDPALVKKRFEAHELLKTEPSIRKREVTVSRSDWVEVDPVTLEEGDPHAPSVDPPGR